MTILEERSRQWQGRGGPAQWAAAWERTRDLLSPCWTDDRLPPANSVEGQIYADGAAGLATALYLVARERGIPVADVHRADVDELVSRKEAETTPEIPRRWEARLRQLGHDLDDTADPVIARWHVLRTDRPEPRHDEDYSITRQGPGLLEGLGYVLAPRLDLQI
ncbi:hypothetical protein [Streptomyces sp. NPDC088755]|uniref:hypothetical protein n=1 Tax=Streptomyces sp. NPDC088755 TaxID=3365888 RepID=UPI00380545DB